TEWRHAFFVGFPRRPEGADHQRSQDSIRSQKESRSTWLSGSGIRPSSGRGGIRTHGTLLTYTHFPGVRLKPLGHPSQHRSKIPTSKKARATSGPSLDTDRERFELSIPLQVCRFSRPVPSTTRPPVQEA